MHSQKLLWIYIHILYIFFMFWKIQAKTCGMLGKKHSLEAS